MNRNLFFPLAILLLWAGFVRSISFMEAWVKFRAEGVTLSVGLSIGMKVFTALNRMEWVFLALFIIASIAGRTSDRIFRAITAIVLGILLVQTFWLLPDLSGRAIRIIAGEQPPRSFTHVLFGVVEVAKVVTLAAGAWLFFRKCSSNGNTLLLGKEVNHERQ